MGGKRKQLEPVGWGAVEVKQIKQSLPFPAVTRVMGLQGSQHSCWGSREAECWHWGRSLWLRFSMADSSRDRLNKTLSRKACTESILPWVQVGWMTFQGVFLQIPVLQDYVGHVHEHMPVTR